MKRKRMHMKEEILRMEHIFLKRRGQYALQDFKLNIYRGEVVIVFGLSGNGIHELGDLLAGGHGESGRILLREQELNIRQDFYPEQHGIYVIQNKDNLVPDLTVAENLFLGERRNIFAMPVSQKKQERLASEIMGKFELKFDVRKKAREYGVYYEQMLIKMVKAYVKGASLVVINEILELPENQWMEQFRRVVRMLRQDGISVLWLTQRVEGIQSLADRMVVVRRGKNVKTIYGNDCSREFLMQIATERENMKERVCGPAEPGEQLLEIRDLAGKSFRRLSLKVSRRQILGFWSNQGVVLADLHGILLGRDRRYTGRMEWKGRPYRPQNYEDAVKTGIGHIDFMWPEKHYLPDMSITDNLMLMSYWFGSHRYGRINEKQRQYTALRYRQRHPGWPTGTWRQLTPDQQRILLYERVMDWPISLCLVAEPFSRVNYYLAEEIHSVFEELRQKEKTLLLFSMNYWDLCRVCDEIYLLPEGGCPRKVSKGEFGSQNV